MSLYNIQYNTIYNHYHAITSRAQTYIATDHAV